jgi:hypothetical protein
MEAERDSLLDLREGVLQLVAVVEDGRGRHDRLELEALEPPDAGQGVGDLSLLRSGLRLVGEVLEPAAAAGRVMGARSLDARRAGLDDLERGGLGVIPLHLRDAGAHGVAWKPAPDEDDEAVQPRDAVPAVGERVDLEVELLILLERGGHMLDGIGGLPR